MSVNEDQIDMAMGRILQPVKDVRITITEHLFVREYLPYIANCKDKELAIKKWLEVCKNPYYPVDVLDNNKNVLFTVPPIWIRQQTRTEYDSKYSMGEIITRAQKRSEISPKQGEAFFNECLPHVLLKTDTDNNYLNEWDKILTRYGYKDTDNQHPVSLEEEFEFDEF